MYKRFRTLQVIQFKDSNWKYILSYFLSIQINLSYLLRQFS